MSNLAQNTINAEINVSIECLILFFGCSINAQVKRSKLLLGHPNTLQLESLDVVTIEFCSTCIPIKQDLFQTKLKVMLPFSGKIHTLFSAGQMCLVGSKHVNVVDVFVRITHSLTLFLKKNLACDGTGPADESKRTKRVQGWSRLNWLGGILIVVFWHIHFNKLLMLLTPVCCFAN